jgi:hypothetical protein
MLNQHPLQTPNHSTFALAARRPNNSQMFRGKSPMQPKFPPRHYSPRQGYGFSALRPYHNQFNRGPQYNRNNFKEITLVPNNNTLEDHTLRIKGVHSLIEIIQTIICNKLRETTSPMTLDHPARYVEEQVT